MDRDEWNILFVRELVVDDELFNQHQQQEGQMFHPFQRKQYPAQQPPLAPEDMLFLHLKTQQHQLSQFTTQYDYYNDQLSLSQTYSQSLQLHHEEFQHYNHDLHTQLTTMICEFFNILNYKNNIELYIQAYGFQQRLGFINLSKQGGNGENYEKIHKQVRDDLKNKLVQLRKVAETFIMKGNLMHSVRKAFKNNFIQPGSYVCACKFIISILVRQLQRYITQKCHKAIKPIRQIKHLSQIVREIIDYKSYFTEEQIQTMKKLFRAIFKIDRVNYISNKEIFRFYKAMRRVDSRGLDMGECGRGVMEMFRYYPYQEPQSRRQVPRRFDEFESEFYMSERNNKHTHSYTINNNNSSHDYHWMEVMNRRIISGYLSCRDLSQLKDNLQRIYTLRSRRFQIPHIQRKLNQLLKLSIKFIKQDYKQYCLYKNIRKIDFSGKKLLTLNNFQIEILIRNEYSVSIKKLLLDYYLRMFYTNRNSNNIKLYTKYRSNYMQYIAYAIKQFLQTKRHIRFVMTEAQEEKYMQYEVDGLQERYMSQTIKANSIYRELRKNIVKFNLEINRDSGGIGGDQLQGLDMGDNLGGVKVGMSGKALVSSENDQQQQYQQPNTFEQKNQHPVQPAFSQAKKQSQAITLPLHASPLSQQAITQQYGRLLKQQLLQQQYLKYQLERKKSQLKSRAIMQQKQDEKNQSKWKRLKRRMDRMLKLGEIEEELESGQQNDVMNVVNMATADEQNSYQKMFDSVHSQQEQQQQQLLQQQQQNEQQQQQHQSKLLKKQQLVNKKKTKLCNNVTISDRNNTNKKKQTQNSNSNNRSVRFPLVKQQYYMQSSSQYSYEHLDEESSFIPHNSQLSYSSNIPSHQSQVTNSSSISLYDSQSSDYEVYVKKNSRMNSRKKRRIVNSHKSLSTNHKLANKRVDKNNNMQAFFISLDTSSELELLHNSDCKQYEEQQLQQQVEQQQQLCPLSQQSQHHQQYHHHYQLLIQQPQSLSQLLSQSDQRLLNFSTSFHQSNSQQHLSDYCDGNNTLIDLMDRQHDAKTKILKALKMKTLQERFMRQYRSVDKILQQQVMGRGNQRYS